MASVAAGTKSAQKAGPHNDNLSQGSFRTVGLRTGSSGVFSVEGGKQKMFQIASSKKVAYKALARYPAFRDSGFDEWVIRFNNLASQNADGKSITAPQFKVFAGYALGIPFAAVFATVLKLYRARIILVTGGGSRVESRISR